MRLLRKPVDGRTIALRILTYPFDEENALCSDFGEYEVCRNSFQSTLQSTITSITSAILHHDMISNFNATPLSPSGVNFVLHHITTFMPHRDEFAFV